MDDLAAYNQQRWDDLARADTEFSRPLLDLDEQSARAAVDSHGLLGGLAGRDVLCLAGGGGQQSAALALLGATVTVLDLSPLQLERDRQAAAHYHKEINTVQGDMRDLSALDKDSFDIVYQPYSINFVPRVQPVFTGVARVLRPAGRYCFQCHNPFTMLVDDEAWDGRAYPLRHPYRDGLDVTGLFPHWDVEDEAGQVTEVASPREFVHALGTLVRSLAAAGFVILGAWEDLGEAPEAQPGSWEHYMSVAAPYLTFWTTYRPEMLAGSPWQ